MRSSQRQPFFLLRVVIILAVGVLMPATVNAQDDEDSASPVQFNGHSFVLPHSIADGFTAFVVDDTTAPPAGSDSPQPARTEFRLQRYSDMVVPPAVGWVNIYSVHDLEGYAAYEHYDRLRELLREQPDLRDEETLPTLYPYQQSALPPDRYGEFFINAAYLDAAGYQGITFIYGRIIYVGDRPAALFYRLYFEGISSDGLRYLSAQVEGLPDLIESLEAITDRDEYLTQAQALFQQSSDEAIIAWLNQANVLFSSFDDTAES